MKNILSSLLILLGIIGIFLLFFQGIRSDNNVSQPNTYNVYALDLPDHIDFAQESVPLHIPDVRERLDRELLVNVYWQSNGLLLIKRAHKYFPTIISILKKNNIPEDFAYLALIESGLQDIVSPAGAAGFWQFMKTTAQQYGLEVNKNIDERYHLEKATQAACQYLKDAYNATGSWTLAAAAYNAGLSGIQMQMKTQQVSNYYDLLLNAETSRYVFRILAVKEILKNPSKYGFRFNVSHLYTLQNTKEIPVNYEIENLTDFAQAHHITYKELKLLNPWLRENSLKNSSRKTYFIKIPL